MSSTPEWLAVLRAARAAHGPTHVGKVIGYSAAVVIGVCEGTYAASTHRVEEAVRATLMASEVPCPVLGAIPLQTCRKTRAQPFSAASPTRVRLWRTCPTCPHNPASTSPERSTSPARP